MEILRLTGASRLLGASPLVALEEKTPFFSA
jgi:hypothetical protein